MDSLRLVLMVIALLVFVGVFFWSSRSEKRTGKPAKWRRATAREAPSLSDLSHDDYDDSDIEAVRMSPLDEPADEPQETQERMIITESEDELLTGTQGAFPFDELSDDGTSSPMTKADTTDTIASDAATAKAKPARENILLLGLMSDSEQGFSGSTALSAFREVGLEHGDMNIFHHFGIGHPPAKKPLFSLANMFEPGDFDPRQLEHAVSSSGYVLFMRADGQRDDRVSLELMLNTANRLAVLLDAQVLDRSRQPLSEETIEQMRIQIANA